MARPRPPLRASGRGPPARGDEGLGRKRCQRAEASETAPNYRNRCSRKTVKTQLGEVEIKELYDVEISPELVAEITEKIMPEVTAWQNRPLEAVYPFVFMDAIHYKVKEDRRYVTKAAYVVLGITMDGTKDIPGLWDGEHEGSEFWLNVLNDRKSRGSSGRISVLYRWPVP